MAGLKLYGRNPSAAPKKAMAMVRRTGSLSSEYAPVSTVYKPVARYVAMNMKLAAVIADTPVHRPSRPSIRFAALQPPRTSNAMMIAPSQ